MAQTIRQALPAVLLGMLLVVSTAFAPVQYAYAGEAEVRDASAKMEEASARYEEASAKVGEINQRIAENEQKLSSLQTEIDSKKADCNAAVCSMYRYQRSTSMLVDLVFSTEDVSTLFGTMEYLNRYESSIRDVVEEQTDRMHELQSTSAQLESDKAQADQAKADAQEALVAAQEARDAAMEQAAAEAAAAAAASSSASTGRGGIPYAYADPLDTVGIDFGSDKRAFVDEWAPRIDAYLSGSPLEGYGQLFASAAWDNGVDPRWSPAISTVESSTGRYCFRSYNAWGWGKVSWSSWEEAIPEHINGLARLYGSTLTMASARKYNYETPTEWYYKCLSEMNKI